MRWQILKPGLVGAWRRRQGSRTTRPLSLAGGEGGHSIHHPASTHPPFHLSVRSTVHPPSWPGGRVNLPPTCTMASDCSRTRAMKALRGSHETAQGGDRNPTTRREGCVATGGDWISHPAMEIWAKERRREDLVHFGAPAPNSLTSVPPCLRTVLTVLLRNAPEVISSQHLPDWNDG